MASAVYCVNSHTILDTVPLKIQDFGKPEPKMVPIPKRTVFFTKGILRGGKILDMSKKKVKKVHLVR